VNRGFLRSRLGESAGHLWKMTCQKVCAGEVRDDFTGLWEGPDPACEDDTAGDLCFAPFERHKSKQCAGPPLNEWPTVVPPLVNMEQLLRLLLVDGMVANSDCLLTKYNNYYMYNYIGATHTCNTAKAGAVLARASRLFEKHDASFAALCREAAQRAWSWLEAHPEPTEIPHKSTCQIYVVNQDAMDRIWLAIELFRATGEAKYHSAFKKGYAALDSKFPPRKPSTQTMRIDSSREALLSYALDSRADAQIRAKILSDLEASCDAMITRSDSAGYGNILPREYWKHRHTIGNNLHLAFELLILHHLTGDLDSLRVARRQLDYILGANPLDKLFITGMEPNGIRAPHYRPYSIRELAPVGLTVKGPTHDGQFLQKVYKDKGRPVPPPMKAYFDRRTDHWCNEPDIEVQGYLVLFLGYFHFTAAEAAK
jgi:endoglucanase